MKLTDSQIETLRTAAAAGDQLNDLQKIIQNEFKLSITFMETRFLISDLGISIITETEPVVEEETPADVPNPEEATGGVKVSVDQVTRPGAMVNGSVTWSDGVSAQWVLDEMGRISLESADENYQPTPEDAEAFQTQLRALIGG